MSNYNKLLEYLAFLIDSDLQTLYLHLNILYKSKWL